MTTQYIDLEDVQGNIVKGYGRYGYPFGRYVFYSFTELKSARDFVSALLPYVTNGKPWLTRENLPAATTNLGFSYRGLKSLGLPIETLHSFPQEFSMGMKARNTILGDDHASGPDHWDPIWQDDKSVHMFLSVNARTPQALTERYDQIQQLLHSHRAGVQQLSGHRGPDGTLMDYQEAAALFESGLPTPKEHFGYTDGISDPYFKGCGLHPANIIGGGKPTRGNPTTAEGWQALETGEFLLGYRDETQELPQAPAPPLLGMNGTFMVYRKLHQNVGSFNRYLDQLGQDFPGGRELLSAKMVGRWKNGVPLTSFPDKAEADAFAAKLDQARERLYAATTEPEKTHAREHFESLRKHLTAFNYNADIEGKRCPVGAHMRRANPRGALEYGVTDAYETPGALVDRRRLLRRGLPYGIAKDPYDDNGNHGIIFMALNASINRQFEFVQQQWMNYGNDFKRSNEKDPVLGNHDGTGEFQIQGSGPDKPPFFCAKLPRFIETRGGEYFFIPSLTAIRMIAEGLIDPT